MSVDPREALDKLFAAFREHMELVLAIQDPEDDDVLDAGYALGDAFDEYDEALYQATGVDTPLDNLDSDDDDDDDHDGDEDEGDDVLDDDAEDLEDLEDDDDEEDDDVDLDDDSADDEDPTDDEDRQD